MPTLPAFTVFDVETTGLDPKKGHRIVEIAGVRVENGIIYREEPFMQLVNPERPIPWEAKSVNNIQDEEVANAPPIEEVLPAFLEFATGSVLVAQNARFDMSFLDAEKEMCWGFVDLPECLCTMKLSQALYPHEFRHNLDVIATRFGLEMPEARHRALPDVLLTAQALLRMMQDGNISSVDELREKAGIKQLVG
jgi:DNA polymerase III subunit epsilon